MQKKPGNAGLFRAAVTCVPQLSGVCVSARLPLLRDLPLHPITEVVQHGVGRRDHDQAERGRGYQAAPHILGMVRAPGAR